MAKTHKDYAVGLGYKIALESNIVKALDCNGNTLIYI